MFFIKIINYFFLIEIFVVNDAKSECMNSYIKPFKTYKIDLDKPARERFSQPSIDFQDEIRALFEARKLVKGFIYILAP